MNSKQEEIKLLEELRQFGTPVDESILENLKTMSDALRIEQYGAQIENLIYLKPSGILGVTINLCIENISARNITIANVRLTMPWFNETFRWLPKQPPKVLNQWGGYVVPACGTYGFDASDVINHRLCRNFKLSPGDALDGLLLGEGTASVPTKFGDRCRIPMKLTVFTSNNHEFSTAIELGMAREQQKSATAGKRMSEVYKQERKTLVAGQFA